MSLSRTTQQGLADLFGENVQFDLVLAPYTSIRIGGKADAVIWPDSLESLQKGITFVREKKISHYVLGKGSNTLVRDGGVRGAVFVLSKGFRRFSLFKENGNTVWITADAGVPTQQLVRWCASQGFFGMEKLAGIPGTVGGNVFMNAGTYLGEVKDILEEVTFCDARGKMITIPKEKIKFQYRKSSLPPSSVVVRALFRLEKGDVKKLNETVHALFDKRGLSQPVEKPNLGSIFKNPGKKKAWELVEEAGCRGVRVGGARVSDKHANFIVNEGEAKAKDVEVLINMIKEKVKQASGLNMETEIRVIGEVQ